MKKILVEMHHGIGDIIHIIPLLNHLKYNFPNAEISVIVGGEAQKKILERLGYLKNIYVMNFNVCSKKHILLFILRLRKERFNIGFVSPISNVLSGSIFVWLAGCKLRIGETKGKKIHFYNRPINGENRIHRVDRNLALLSVLKNIQYIEKNPYLPISDEEINWAEEQLGSENTVAVCMGTGKILKKIKHKKYYYNAKFWGMKKTMDLIERLLEGGYKVALIGGREEENDNLEILREFEKKQGISNYVNKLTIIETAAILKKCKLVFGCDTGAIHIADAVNVPTVTIFGPTDPCLVGAYSQLAANYSLKLSCQYCYGTNELELCESRKCLEDVEVSNIFEIIRKILDKKRDKQ